MILRIDSDQVFKKQYILFVFSYEVMNTFLAGMNCFNEIKFICKSFTTTNSINLVFVFA